MRKLLAKVGKTVVARDDIDPRQFPCRFTKVALLRLKALEKYGKLRPGPLFGRPGLEPSHDSQPCHIPLKI